MQAVCSSRLADHGYHIYYIFETKFCSKYSFSVWCYGTTNLRGLVDRPKINRWPRIEASSKGHYLAIPANQKEIYLSYHPPIIYFGTRASLWQWNTARDDHGINTSLLGFITLQCGERVKFVFRFFLPCLNWYLCFFLWSSLHTGAQLNPEGNLPVVEVCWVNWRWWCHSSSRTSRPWWTWYHHKGLPVSWTVFYQTHSSFTVISSAYFSFVNGCCHL